MRPSLLDNIIVVLVEPQDVVNIAGVVRSMKNMGVGALRLVRPADFNGWRIAGIAHRSEDLIEDTKIFDTLAEALADCPFVVGTSARARTAQRNYGRPRDLAPRIAGRARENPTAIVFGREDRGLANEDLDLCNVVTIIPTVPDYSSLNLAQACLLVLYEIFLCAEASDTELPRGRRATRPASSAELEKMYSALESGLARIEFFKGRAPEGILRTLRTVLGRAEPDLREARLVQAIGFEIGHFLDRIAPSGGPFEEDPGGEQGSD